MTVQEMATRFDAFTKERLAYLFGEWINMTWDERDAKEAEIEARHNYKHGWIVANGISFDRHMAYPNEVFANVWD